jgi:hypothetical protein
MGIIERKFLAIIILYTNLILVYKPFSIFSLLHTVRRHPPRLNQELQMTLLLLIRHGENEFVKTGKLAGRLPDVHLNERGQKQALDLAEALATVPIKAVYSSPMERASPTTRARGPLPWCCFHPKRPIGPQTCWLVRLWMSATLRAKSTSNSSKALS